MSSTPLGRILLDVFSSNRRRLRRLGRRAAAIQGLAPSLRTLDDAQLLKRGKSLRERHLAGETLDHLLMEAFACVQEAIRRALGLELRPPQIMGAIALYEGEIAEMATGEGKSVMALLPAFLEGLAGRGVHLATLNPYLAERDQMQAQSVLGRLGSSVGLVRQDMTPAVRRRAYSADITYGAFGEFAHDYLQDNRQLTLKDVVQRGHAFAILDEIDAILIDEARAPLNITESHEPSEQLYRAAEKVVRDLAEDLTEIDPQTNAVYLTDKGQDEVEAALRDGGLLEKDGSLYDQENAALAHHMHKALQARFLYRRDKDYFVSPDGIVLIDAVTGRALPGRRLGDGLHQAIEAKEGQPLGPETQVVASISMQNYFRLYERLAGMTATAAENANEFSEIYGLDVTSLPSWKPSRRSDLPDQVFQTLEEKFTAVVQRVSQAHKKGQPVLVGTTSIGHSETLSQRFTAAGLPHAILTARQAADEAKVIAQAGLPGAITIATNMAGRGTDIRLGGPPPPADASTEEQAAYTARQKAAEAAGGLLIVGTERHDSRRLDKQLRGRAGRQGDVGASIFLLSLEDDLLRPILASDPDYFKNRQVGSHGGQLWAKGFITSYQKQIEMRHSRIRVVLMQFDSVIHQQRKVIFAERLRLMQSKDLPRILADMREQVVADLVARHLPADRIIQESDFAALRASAHELLGLEPEDLLAFDQLAAADRLEQEKLELLLKERAAAIAERREKEFGADMIASIHRQTVLSAIDEFWNQHERAAERLRSLVGFRSHGRRDPLSEYQTEVFELFETMLSELRFAVTKRLAMTRPLNPQKQTQVIEGLLFGPRT